EFSRFGMFENFGGFRLVDKRNVGTLDFPVRIEGIGGQSCAGLSRPRRNSGGVDFALDRLQGLSAYASEYGRDRRREDGRPGRAPKSIPEFLGVVARLVISAALIFYGLSMLYRAED